MRTTTARTGSRIAHPLLRRAVHRRVDGRRIDPSDRTRGRFRNVALAPSRRPGYEVEYADTGEAFLTTWTWCPPYAFVQQLVDKQGDHGEVADRCDMVWVAADTRASART